MVKPQDSTHEGDVTPLDHALRKAEAAAAQADDKRRTAETYEAGRLPRDVANVTRLLRAGRQQRHPR